MAFYISTALDNQTYNAVRGPVSGVASLQGGYIAIYSGTPPASADAAATGTLLLKITNSAGEFSPGVYQTTNDDSVCASQAVTSGVNMTINGASAGRAGAHGDRAGIPAGAGTATGRAARTIGIMTSRDDRKRERH